MKVARVEKSYTPWKVDVPKSLTGTRRVRKFFTTREAADAYIVRVRREGFARADLNGAQPGSPETGVRLDEAVGMFLGRSEAKSATTRSQLRYVLKSLTSHFGSACMAGINHREIEAWLAGVQGGPTTRYNHFRVGRRFFQWAVDWLEELPRNPFKKVARPAQKNFENITVLTADQMQKCLHAAEALEEPERSRILGYLCLGGFAGLRTAEILHARWEDIDLKSGEIYVRQPKRVKGWRPRYVAIQPALRRHLQPLMAGMNLKDGQNGEPKPRGKQGTFSHDFTRVMPGGQRTLWTIRCKIKDAMGWDSWPDNCLRHSFGTYHLAKHKDLAKLRTEMGHESEDITRKHYALAAKKADAAAWWKL